MMTKLAGHRHPGDVLGSPLGDAVVVRLEFGSAPAVRDGLDGRPADQFGAGLGDTPPADLGVRLVVLGGQPCPRAQRLRVAKRETSPISATMIAAMVRPTPGMA